MSDGAAISDEAASFVESAPTREAVGPFAPLTPRDPHVNEEARGPHELDANPRYLVHRDFTSAFLPDARDLLVYLPEAYFAEPGRRFPVFYLHDGQNLFDGRTSYLVDRTWQIHTTGDRLVREGRIEPLIFVGINNTGPRRMAEYTPTRDVHFRGGEGDRYGALLTGELKPLIDKAFRTLTGPEHTGLGGSSLGGLISLYLGLQYPEIFGRLAVLSPSVWWDSRSLLRLASEARPASPSLAHPRIWLDMGTAEGLRHLRDTDLLAQRLRLRGWREGPFADSARKADLRYLRVSGGLHEEAAWAARFDQVLEFLFPANSAPGA